MLDAIRERYQIPIQICVLAHLTTQIQALTRGAPECCTLPVRVAREGGLGGALGCRLFGEAHSRDENTTIARDSLVRGCQLEDMESCDLFKAQNQFIPRIYERRE